ncbi:MULTISPECIES: hypothetical protein [unclassified Mycobacterium]|uniref:hypothetical protein n=1 Tax=unclassified Mycobacterium TaxID=2642494 RepID=UPI0007FFE4F5|nr:MULTISPECIES: hypothetical protein [unclassified Mycobacterium]OBG75822.1 hypothetical protein A5700_23435 [Mycobacterium sp. E1214]
MAVLCCADGPLSTRALTERINVNREPVLTHERVYDALLELHRRGLVERRKSGRQAYWHVDYWQADAYWESVDRDAQVEVGDSH